MAKSANPEDAIQSNGFSHNILSGEKECRATNFKLILITKLRVSLMIQQADKVTLT